MRPGRWRVKVIINADDFGRTREINRAVILAHGQGILTSASLMVAGKAADEAVQLARKHPDLAVGLHVVVVDGPAALAGGEFPDAPVRLGLRYAFGRAARRKLARELRAQFERFAATGLELSHVDGHQHMHMHPVVFDMLLPLAQEFGARGVRIVRDELRLALRFDRRRAVAKGAAALIFSALAARCRRKIAGTGLAAPDRTYGFFQSGAMTEQYVLDVIAVLSKSGAGSAEVYFHPTCGRRLDPLGPNPDDLAALVSPSVRQALLECGLQPGTHFDLSGTAGVPCHAP